MLGDGIGERLQEPVATAGAEMHVLQRRNVGIDAEHGPIVGDADKELPTPRVQERRNRADALLHKMYGDTTK